jgi:hypothetical protein
MRRPRQIWIPAILVLCVIGLKMGLAHWQPTIDGQALRDVELSTPLARLQPAEYAPLFAWLMIDTAFAVICTVFFTWGLRRLSADFPPGRLNTLGRALSWITALAILFNLVENAVLYTAASIGATHVSPWLSLLVKLEWLPASIFAAYMIAWALRNPAPKLPGAGSSPRRR